MVNPSDVEECSRAEVNGVNGVAQIYFLVSVSCVIRVSDSESSFSVYSVIK